MLEKGLRVRTTRIIERNFVNYPIGTKGVITNSFRRYELDDRVLYTVRVTTEDGNSVTLYTFENELAPIERMENEETPDE